MGEPYHYVRFRWERGADLRKATEELSGRFKARLVAMPRDDEGFSLFKGEREELRVQADTLMAALSPFRAVLLQRRAAPFTPLDLELRRRVLELYPRNRPSPFPWLFSVEPKFEIAP